MTLETVGVIAKIVAVVAYVVIFRKVWRCLHTKPLQIDDIGDKAG